MLKYLYCSYSLFYSIPILFSHLMVSYLANSALYVYYIGALYCSCNRATVCLSKSRSHPLLAHSSIFVNTLPIVVLCPDTTDTILSSFDSLAHVLMIRCLLFSDHICRWHAWGSRAPSASSSSNRSPFLRRASAYSRVSPFCLDFSW